jgi:hypothetical protein
MRIELLFEALKMRYSFYVLGAGASAGIIPLTNEIGDKIICDFINRGSYSIDFRAYDKTYKRIIGEDRKYDDLLIEEIVGKMPLAFLQTATVTYLTPLALRETPSQYTIFSFARSPSTFFSMNVDGLARRFCIGHIVLEPHGRIPISLVRREDWQLIMDGIVDYNIDFPKFHGVLLPQPEPRNITSRVAYDRAIKLFPLAHYLVIIGYSFGKFKNSIDDYETFEFFRDLLKYHPKPVIIIDPQPEKIVGLVQESINRKDVYSIPAYWNALTRAVFETACRFKCRNVANLLYLKREILYSYEQYCDINNIG